MPERTKRTIRQRAAQRAELVDLTPVESASDSVSGTPAGLPNMAELFAAEPGGSLQDRVFRVLRAAILEGRLPPDQKVTEQDLSAALNVSRTPLREAFRRLEAEGLVTPSPSRGVIVRGLNWKDFEDIYEIRGMLEPLAARRAASRISAQALEELRGHLELAEFLASKKRFKDVEAHNHEFHQIIYRECGNARLRVTLTGLSDYVHRSPLYQEHGPGASLELLEEHRQLYDALAAHDVRAAERAAKAHATRNQARVIIDPGETRAPRTV
jgi:DNA-binding GntR family transcriptional regulator